MNYQNSRIYKIVNDVSDDIYIGSTCQPLSKRMAEHRSKAKQHPNRKIYQKFNEIGVEHFKIVLIEEYKCINKEELVAREDYYINLMKPVLNSRYAHRTELQKKECNKSDKIDEYQRLYREQNKDKIDERQRLYREQNKDKRNECNKLCYERNKEIIACECGRSYIKRNKKHHLRTKIHNRGL